MRKTREQIKQRPKNRSALAQQFTPAITQIQNLLQVNLVLFTNKKATQNVFHRLQPLKLPDKQKQRSLDQKTTSQRQKIRQFKIKTRISSNSSANTTAQKQTLNVDQDLQPSTISYKDDRDFIQRQEKIPQFKEKKMGIVKKKTNAMKAFIIQTLNKAKAQGTCLIVHKGTAQCGYSPPSKQPQKNKKIKQQFPLILVQNNRQISRKPSKSIFKPSVRKPLVPGNNSTKINLPSLNKNKQWVQMAKKYQKKQNKQKNADKAQENQIQSARQVVQSIPQAIELQQNQNVQHEIQEIRQQIVQEDLQSSKVPKNKKF